MNSKFTNPFANIPDEELSRVNADVPTSDYKMLQRILTERGVIQTTTNILLDKLFHELHKRGITDYTRAKDFVDFITGCQLVYDTGRDSGGEAVVRPARQTGRVAHRGRTQSQGGTNTAVEAVSPVPESCRD